MENKYQIALEEIWKMFSDKFGVKEMDKAVKFIDCKNTLQELIDNYLKLEKELENTYKNSLLVMTDKELKDYKAFFSKHYKNHLKERYGNNKICMKNPLPEWKHVIELTGTGLGDAITIKCPICGETKDITDVESW